MSEKLFTQKYKYTGPTMLLGECDSIELRWGDVVEAEVDVNIATVVTICKKSGTTVLNDDEVDIAARYLEPVCGAEDGQKPPKRKSLYQEYCEYCDEQKAKKQNIPEKLGDNIEVGGDHYQTAIQPWDFIYANHIGFDAGNAIKYLCRYEKKGGAEDIKKAISYCKHILKTQYGEEV